MTTYLGKSCSFGLLRVPFVNCGIFMYLVISLFGFEGRMWDLIVSVPDHCLSFYSSLTALWFILNMKIKHTKFICSVDSITMTGMVPTHSMTIYDSERYNVIHPNSCLHVFYYTQNSQKQSNHQFATFIRYVCRCI